MTSIPKEIYSRYHCADMSEYENELDFYQTFLIVTDHIPNKIVEQLIEDMATATLVDFISVFINFIKNVRIEYKEVLECRKFARDEINRLEVSE